MHPATPGLHPETDAILADGVSHSLLVVLDRLSPAQRVAFVFHNVFTMPFDDIGQILNRSPIAAKKLASRAPNASAAQPHSRRDRPENCPHRRGVPSGGVGGGCHDTS